MENKRTSPTKRESAHRANTANTENISIYVFLYEGAFENSD